MMILDVLHFAMLPFAIWQFWSITMRVIRANPKR